ncbi:MAG: hypothetical protein WD068_01175 [Candidatus Babeliales bacterium]
MKLFPLIGCMFFTAAINATVDLSKSFKTVQKHIAAIKKELTTFAHDNPAHEVRNLTQLLRIHINLMASGTTAQAPQYANQELEVKKHLEQPAKALFSKIRDQAHELNQPSKLYGGSTISFEAETYLAGIIALLRDEIAPHKEALPTENSAQIQSTDATTIKKYHKEGVALAKKHNNSLSNDDKKLIASDTGLIDTYKDLHTAKAQRGSIGPAAPSTLTTKINTAANREIELFTALSVKGKEFFKKIRDYATYIAAQDTFVGGLSPKVSQFLDAVKKKMHI